MPFGDGSRRTRRALTLAAFAAPRFPSGQIRMPHNATAFCITPQSS